MNDLVGQAPGSTKESHSESREKYYAEIARLLNGIPLENDKNDSFGRIFKVFPSEDHPAHFAVVTFGCSWHFGNELVVRFTCDSCGSQGDRNDADVSIEVSPVVDAINAVFFLLFFMQKNVKFKSPESCEISYPLPWVHQASILVSGSIIVEDSILHGTNYVDGEYNIAGPFHNELYWPQHFLSLYFLFPEEYHFCQGVSLKDFIAIIRSNYTKATSSLINDFARKNFLLNDLSVEQELNLGNESIVFQALADLKSRSPAKVELPDVTMDIRVRKKGKSVDLVFNLRSMGHVMTAIHSAFSKPFVPQGSVVLACNTQCFVYFYCHDDNGDEITPASSLYNIYRCCVANPVTEEIIPISPGEFQSYAMLSPGHLWRGYGLGRVLQLAVYLTPLALASLPLHLHAIIEQRVRPSDPPPVDLNVEPLVIDLYDILVYQRVKQKQHKDEQEGQEEHQIGEFFPFFSGHNAASGFRPEVRAAADSGCEGATLDPPARLRLVVAGSDYFNDSMFISNDGDFLYCFEQ